MKKCDIIFKTSKNQNNKEVTLHLLNLQIALGPAKQSDVETSGGVAA